MTDKQDLAVIILAAGHGKRMQSELPKVLHPVVGQPMLAHVLTTAKQLKPAKIVVITGYGAQEVETVCDAIDADIICARQEEQLGTGHAVKCAEDALAGFSGNILILFGDAPLVSHEQLNQLITLHDLNGNAVTTLTGNVAEPAAYGRIIRDNSGKFLGTQEAKDCSPEELKITEVASAIFVVESEYLWPLLAKVQNNNNQNEYYLNSIEPLAMKEQLGVDAVCVEDVYPLLGCNSRKELAEAERYVQDKLRDQAMANGTTLLDPATVYFSLDTQLGKDVTVGPNVTFGPNVSIADHVTIAGNAVISHTSIATGEYIEHYSQLDGSTQQPQVQNPKISSIKSRTGS